MSQISALRERSRDLLNDATSALDSGDRPGYERVMGEVKEAQAELNRAVDRRDEELEQVLHGRVPAGADDLRNPADAYVGRPQPKDVASAKLDGIWPSFADFVRDLQPRRLLARGTPRPLAALTEGTDTAGGYLVPSEFRGELLRLSVEDSIVRRRARVVPVTSDTLSLPAVNESDRSGGSVFAGLTAAWAAEGATLGEDNPTFTEVNLSIHKLTLLATLSNELMMDGNPALGVVLPQMFSEGIRFSEDSAFLNGDGATQPLGVLNAANAALLTVARATASEVAWADVTGMFARLLPASRSRAIWLASQSIIPQLFGMTLGTGENAIFVQSGSAVAPPTMLGLPIIFSEHSAALGSQGDLALLDLSHYIIADRMQLSIQVSEHEKFSSDQTVIRGVERLDGRPWLPGAITPANGGDTLSAFVALTDAA